MILNEIYPLANGVQIPKLGLGTWFIDDAKAAEVVRAAVKLGYRSRGTARVEVRALTPGEQAQVGDLVAAARRVPGDAGATAALAQQVASGNLPSGVVLGATGWRLPRPSTRAWRPVWRRSARATASARRSDRASL